MKNRRLIAILFCGAVGLLYLSLSPGSIAGMGYTGEEMKATDALLSAAAAPFTGQPPLPIEWPRNGVVDLVFHAPFIVAGNVLAPGSFHWKGRLLSLEPVLLTSLLVTVVFLWTAALTRSWALGFVLSLVFGFCTLIWPYAYIVSPRDAPRRPAAAGPAGASVSSSGALGGE